MQGKSLGKTWLVILGLFVFAIWLTFRLPDSWIDNDLFFWAWLIFWSLVWGAFGSSIAEYKRRRNGVWFLVCFLTGLFGLAILSVTPKIKKKKKKRKKSKK